MAPEVYEDKIYNVSCDVFSFAMVAWEMISKSLLCMELPNCVSTEAIVQKLVHETWRPPLSSDWPLGTLSLQ